MCLSVVTKRSTGGKSESGTGFKVMMDKCIQPDNTITWISPIMDSRLSQGTEQTSLKMFRIPPAKNKYQTGFHIFKSLHGAIAFKQHLNVTNYWKRMNLKIVKVKWRHRLAEGTEDKYKCVVAKFQTIIGEHI